MSTNSVFKVEATLRDNKGKGASRRLRREEKVPAVVYGAGQDAMSLTLEHNKIAKALQTEAFYSHILTLNVDGKAEKVILKDVQRHAYKPKIVHVDFQRVRADQKLHMHVPLHFVGADQCPGAKEGGVVSHIMSDVEIACLPANLPEYIEVDITNLELNQTLHLSELAIPEGVEILALSQEDDKAVVTVHLPRAEKEPEPEAAEGEEAGDVPASEQKAEGEGEAKADASEEKKEGKE